MNKFLLCLLSLLCVQSLANAAYQSSFPADAWLPPEPSQVSNAMEFTLDQGYQFGSTNYYESGMTLVGQGYTGGAPQTVNATKPLFVSFTIEQLLGQNQTVPASEKVTSVEIGYRINNDASTDKYIPLTLIYIPGMEGGSYLGNAGINIPANAQGTLFVWARYSKADGSVNYISNNSQNYSFGISSAQ